MVKIYVNDQVQSSSNSIVTDQLEAGTSFYNNSEGKPVLIETWTDTVTSDTNNFKSYIDTSNVQIKNLCKLNGTYISTYVYDDNYVNGTQTKLVVYFIGVNNKYRIKVTYLDNFTKVIIKRVK